MVGYLQNVMQENKMCIYFCIVIMEKGTMHLICIIMRVHENNVEITSTSEIFIYFIQILY